MAVCGLTATIEADDTTVETSARGVRSITFTSRALKKRKTFCAVIPGGANGSLGKWPVLLMLHGRGRHRRSLLEDHETREMLFGASLITILPDGDDGWYINSPTIPKDRYNDYLEEVLQVATRALELDRRRERWGISGWSMGGYGCVMFAQSHPERFAAVAPIIGLLDFPRDGLPEGQDYQVPTNRFGEDPGVWKKLNPLSHVQQLRNEKILVVTAARAFDRTMNEHFRDRLAEARITHRYVELSGGHTFATVRRALPTVLRFMEVSLGDVSR